MKKILLGIIGLFVILIITYFIVNEPVPKGTKNKQAEQFADSLLRAINYENWQKTAVVSWEFPRGHLHVWDKDRHFSEVKWDDNRVIFHIDSLDGIAYKNDVKVTGEASKELIKEAWEYWANDSFWLNAPSKIRDGGTERQLVTLDNGEKGLLVIYNSGGVTPGDKYLWVCDKNYLPKYCKMWVSVIPIGGVKFNWTDWLTVETGAKIAQNHDGMIDVNLKNIETAKSIQAMFPEGDPFTALIKQLN
jgi:hypothetical protein